uniref:DUF4657 domain-containing protein n=1 Tax=Strix occidentalis caurina TaxID=311401 RepID=A0A8D0ETS7_STROC
MASNEHSPSTPLGSESSFSLDGLPVEKSPPGEEPGTDRPRPPRKKLVQAAQRSRRQRLPTRCPRQLGRRNVTATADPTGDPRDAEEPGAEGPDGAVSAGEGRVVVAGAWLPGSPRAPRACPQAVPGQGLRYLEHVCQMLERLARLQQDNRLLRQEAADARHSRPDTMVRVGVQGGGDGGPTGFPPPTSLTATSPRQDGRSHWGRVKVLLTRLTRRSLRGGRGGGGMSPSCHRRSWMEEPMDELRCAYRITPHRLTSRRPGAGPQPDTPPTPPFTPFFSFFSKIKPFHCQSVGSFQGDGPLRGDVTLPDPV